MLIRNGTVALPTGTARLDIRTQGEKILELAPNLTPQPNEEVIDATDHLILPGFIDSHVHFRDPGGTHKEDFYTGTQAALAGGVTAIIDMPNTNPSTTDRASLALKRDTAATKAVVDYGFYIGATDTNMEEAAALANQVAAMKMYMGSSTGSLLVTEFSPTYRHFQTFPKDKPLAVHAEDEQSLKYFATQHNTEHNKSRPPLSAQIALSRALAIAEKTGRRLHIAHTTTRRELELIKEAKAKGVRVTCEVTPLHFFLTEQDQQRLGNYGKVNPPLRSQDDQNGLWEHFDVIDTIGTDHAPHTHEEKDQSYAQAPSGMTGVQTMLPLLFNAIQQGRSSHLGPITLADIIQRCVVNPINIFGLSTKGALEPGKDADIVIINPNTEYEITNDQILSKCGWTPFAGTRIKGKITQVFLRGHLGYANNQIIAQPGTGKPLHYT